MKAKQTITILILALVAMLTMACGGANGKSARMADSTDSLSYVVGMNIAYNIMQMDSTISPDAVVAGIEDGLRGRAAMTMDDAVRYFLGYKTFDVYERVRAYEEQYLNDLAASDGGVVRANSGLTYKVGELGNMNRTAVSDRDTVAIIYRATNLAGEEVDPVASRADTLRTVISRLKPGLKEGLKLIGEGGKITLWIPSEMAYGSAGDIDKGIDANEMLRYEIDIVEVKRRR